MSEKLQLQTILLGWHVIALCIDSIGLHLKIVVGLKFNLFHKIQQQFFKKV